MSNEILAPGDFEHTMFMHLYDAYSNLVNSPGASEKEYEQLKKVDVMFKAWHSNMPQGEYAGKKYIQNIQAEYAQLWYWKQMLNKYLGDRYAEHQEAPPKEIKYPAGYEQAFQAIVLQSVSNIPEADEAVEKAVEKAIDWSKFCHLHEALRKTWDIELSTDFYTDYSGEPKKLQHRAIKDNPQA